MTSIIIATKDRLWHLQNLIDSIRRYTDDYEIIVVDDVSKDGTWEWLEDQDVTSLTYPESIPVADAWNKGCEVAKGHYIQILNDDMEVTPNWLSNQIELYKTVNNPGVFAAHLLRGEEVLSRGGKFLGTQLVPVPSIDEVQKVDYSNTPFMSKHVWHSVGKFKAHAQMYYEDADFGLKCLKRNKVNLYNPLSVIKHVTLGWRPEDGQEQFERRQHNESVIQQKARESFMKDWREYLENRSNG